MKKILLTELSLFKCCQNCLKNKNVYILPVTSNFIDYCKIEKIGLITICIQKNRNKLTKIQYHMVVIMSRDVYIYICPSLYECSANSLFN